MEDKRIHFVLDSQILSTVQDCGWKAYATFVENWMPSGEISRSLSLGTLTHEVLQSYYRSEVETGRRNMERAIEIIAPHSPKIVQDAQDTELVFAVLRKYHSFYLNDGWQPVMAEESRAKILFEDENYVIAYVVKIDLVINGSNFSGFPCDHKTESRYSEPRKLSNQFRGYCWYMDTHNIWINKIGFQKSFADDKRFRRYLLSYDNDELKEWVEQATYWAKQLIIYMQDGYYPRSNSTCNNFNGCRFRPICEATPSSRQYILQNLFHKGEEWNPLETREIA